jgi:hypothetical protein
MRVCAIGSAFEHDAFSSNHRVLAAIQELAEQWVAELGYRDLVTFHSTDETGAAVYHTNVMMAIGSDVAVVCAEAVPDARERRHLLASLRKHHEVRTTDVPVKLFAVET